MDTKQQQTKAPAPKLVKARVKPGNRYGTREGTAGEGEIVEVDPSELELVQHCLESLDAEKAREVERVKKDEADAVRLQLLEDRRKGLFAARDAQRSGMRILEERRLARLKEKLEKAAG
jgi:hypothetical protein